MYAATAKSDKCTYRRAKRWATFAVRWGIAIVGICYVTGKVSLSDRVMIASPVDGWPVSAIVLGESSEAGVNYRIADPFSTSPGRQILTVEPDHLLVRSNQQDVWVNEHGQTLKREVLALKVLNDPQRERWPLVVTRPRTIWQRYWNTHAAPAWQIDPASVVGPYKVEVPYPVLEVGMARMCRQANLWLLMLAMAVFPVTFVLCSFRWHYLLRALDIPISWWRAFELTMLGSFYSTIIPAGSTGGDFAKAYYVSRQTPRSAHAALSVFVDRVIGLLTLAGIGGSVAAWSYLLSETKESPAAMVCRDVALGALAIIVCTAVAFLVLCSSRARGYLMPDALLRRLPAQQVVLCMIECASVFRARPWLLVWTVLISLPVHTAIVISTMLICQALGLPLTPGYCFVVVPVVVLARAIPISPQGAGVMEFFAILLTCQQGATS